MVEKSVIASLYHSMHILLLEWEIISQLCNELFSQNVSHFLEENKKKVLYLLLIRLSLLSIMRLDYLIEFYSIFFNILSFFFKLILVFSRNPMLKIFFEWTRWLIDISEH
jgi:hypothetical protein